MVGISTRRRVVSVVRVCAVLAIGLAVVGCSSDDDAADSASDSKLTVAATTISSDETMSPVDSTNAPRFDDSSHTPPTDDASDEAKSDPVITTTPPATSVVAGEGASDELRPVAPVPVPGPTVAGELEEEANFGNGVSASIVEVEAVEVEGRLPGERSGPGVLVTVAVDNDSAETISLDFVIVDLVRRDGASAIPVEMTERVALAGELAAGQSAAGKYQFFIPADQRPSATIIVSYAVGMPTALFTGDLPSA